MEKTNPVIAAAEKASKPTVTPEAILEQSIKAGEVAKTAIKNSQAVAAKTAKGTNSAISTIADSNRIITMQEEKARLQTQTVKTKAFQVAGGAPALVSLAAAHGKARDKMVKEVGDVAKLNDITVIDDGLFKYIGAQLKLGLGERQQATAAIAKEQAIRSAITGTQQVTSSIASTLTEVEELKSAATIDALDKNTAAEARMARLKNARALAESNAKATAALYTMNRQQLNDVMAVTQEKRIAQNEAKAYKKESMKEASDDAIVNNYHLAQLKLNQQLLPATDILAAKKIGGTAFQKVQEFYAIGLQVQSDGQSTASYGQQHVMTAKYNPEALVKNNKASQFSSGVTDIVDKTMTAEGVAKGRTPAQTEAAKLNLTDKEAAVRFTKAAESFAKQQKENIAAGNVYEAPPMAVVTNDPSPAIQETVFYDKILKTQKLKETNPQHIFELAAEAVAQKKITFEEAVEGINTLFNFFKEHNNAFGNFAASGIPLQEAYNFQLKLGEASRISIRGYAPNLLASNIVDLTSAEKVRNALVTYLTNRDKYEGSPAQLFNDPLTFFNNE